MSTTELALAGIGVVTPVGLTAAESAANIRAGVSAYAESSIMDRAYDPIVAAIVAPDGMEPLASALADETGITSRELRLIRLGSMALKAAVGSLAIDLATTPVLLGLPAMATKIPIDPARLLKRLALQSGIPFQLKASIGYLEGRASGLTAIAQAGTLLRSGACTAVLAGGVDSYIDPYILSTLDLEKRLNAPSHMDGFTPGEGVGIFLITTPEQASRQRWRTHGRILSIATGTEPGHLYSQEPYRGEGLAGTVQQVVAAAPSVRIGTVVTSLNGENHFAKEWGVAYLRSKPRFADDYRYEHPADCIGDTGAAAGPVQIALALDGIATAQWPAPALVYASADREQRVACIVTVP